MEVIGLAMGLPYASDKWQGHLLGLRYSERNGFVEEHVLIDS